MTDATYLLEVDEVQIKAVFDETDESTVVLCRTKNCDWRAVRTDGGDAASAVATHWWNIHKDNTTIPTAKAFAECSRTDCGEEAKTKGECRTHYMQTYYQANKARVWNVGAVA